MGGSLLERTKMNEDYVVPYRRSFFRYIVEASANLIIDKLRKPVIVKDLCSRGACIFSNSPLEVSGEIEIEIVSCFDKPVYRKAKVVWSKEIEQNLWQAGLDFGLDNLIDLK